MSDRSTTATIAFLIEWARGTTEADLAPLLHADQDVRRKHLELRAAADAEYLRRVGAAQALIAIGINPLVLPHDDSEEVPSDAGN